MPTTATTSAPVDVVVEALKLHAAIERLRVAQFEAITIARNAGQAIEERDAAADLSTDARMDLAARFSGIADDLDSATSSSQFDSNMSLADSAELADVARFHIERKQAA